MSTIQFTNYQGAFELQDADKSSGLYFPLASEKGLKTAITPNLGGDAKLSQNQFVLAPASIENLNNEKSARNFWCKVEKAEKKPILWSATGNSAWQQAMKFSGKSEHATVGAEFMSHQVARENEDVGLQAVITSFIPVDCNTEIHVIELTNISEEALKITPIAAIPIYGRSADNLRDHRHVTSLLHRISVTASGVEVNPTLSFDERGHQLNDTKYFVCGMDAFGANPVAFYPVLDEVIGEGGSLEAPMGLIEGCTEYLPGAEICGQEAIGAFRFAQMTLEPNQSEKYILFIGADAADADITEMLSAYYDAQAVEKVRKETVAYWNEKVNVDYKTADPEFDQFMKWVSFQPELRRVFGCSFLPHHDYGKGGRGWRDLWQDCLALLLMNPAGVREMLLGNFGGVRIDGTNATIIGEKPGEFKADRNGITRVWMDHGVWPFITMKLYLEQTGDYDLLFEKQNYFKDRQVKRGTFTDTEWVQKKDHMGHDALEMSTITKQKTVAGEVYTGTVLEHLLLQNLTAFWEVGEHGYIRLRDADWNDALDMAGKRGESVAFTNAYSKNLLDIADMLEYLAAQGLEKITVLEELKLLLNSNEALYRTPETKAKVLDEYLSQCVHHISGKTVELSVHKLVLNLRDKGNWMMEHIRENQWITDADGNGWYNGYYDNDGNALEGYRGGKADMMLTSQVFAIMSGTATEEQVRSITASADKYLYDEHCGGYRLNTDFQEIKTNMGRMFGFAYGEKENGAVFSHMAVMYANALYTRGFAREGYKALNALYKQTTDFEVSRIYPGLPEYFGRGGRGLYHYLTGSASWYMLTVMNEMFGVKGCHGKLIFEPKLVAEQFDADGNACISFVFHGEAKQLTYHNPKHLDYGCYRVLSVEEADGRVRVELG